MKNLFCMAFILAGAGVSEKSFGGPSSFAGTAPPAAESALSGEASSGAKDYRAYAYGGYAAGLAAAGFFSWQLGAKMSEYVDIQDGYEVIAAGIWLAGASAMLSLMPAAGGYLGEKTAALASRCRKAFSGNQR